jgi:putative nucleotidyltransferase with HDIG domain
MTSDRRSGASSLPLTVFIAAVVGCGAVVIAESAWQFHPASLNAYAIGLAALTVASGRFAIKIPGRPATVSVSEVFVFASILLFGPAVPVLTVALDGLWISISQRDRRLYRAVFNVAEPAISTWTAAHVFFAVTRTTPGFTVPTGLASVLLATAAMAATFFALNSGLSAIAVSLENGSSAFQFWRSHAWYLAVNYYAAASLAALAVNSGARINFGVAALALPLLLLSYVAYQEAATRVDETKRHLRDVEHLYRASVEMLAIAVDAKDQVTHGHIRRVQRHTLAVAAALGVSDKRELKAIEAGALLHDIGKLATPDYLLNKPSGLTNAEFETMKKHASMGARILTAVDFPYPVVPIVRHHHERWDGRGYPDGLVGAEIPLGARILGVVDCFDALASDRPYRVKLTDDQAIAVLRSRRGTYYEPAIVDTFVDLIPALRQDDHAADDPAVPQASVVAGLARTAQVGGADPESLHTTMPSVPQPVRALIQERMRAFPLAEACLFRLSSANDMLVPAFATSRLDRIVSRLELPVGSGVSGWVAANRSAIRDAQAILDLGDIVGTCGLERCTVVPVFRCAELFGVLSVYTPETGWTGDMTDAIGLLAQEVGVLLAHESSLRAHHRLSAAAS